MTPDEHGMLADLAAKIAQTPTPPKDAEAEDFIRTKIGSRPDALYLMTQTVLIQNMALQQAQQQIQELRSSGAAQISSGSSSFLGQQQPRSAGYGSQGGSYAAPPPPQYAAPSPAVPGPSVSASGAPSFLRGAAQTAAGVAAGALAFEGIQSLFSHSGFGGGGGGMFGGGGVGGYGAPVEETVVNNYYEGNEGGRGGDSARDNFNDNRDDYQATDDVTNVDDSQFDDSGSGFDDNSGGDTFS